MSPSVALAVGAVMKRFGQDPADAERFVTTRDRTGQRAHVRRVSIWLCRTLYGLSFPVLAAEFSRRDHSTMMSAVRRVDGLRLEDARLAALLDSLLLELDPTEELRAAAETVRRARQTIARGMSLTLDQFLGHMPAKSPAVPHAASVAAAPTLVVGTRRPTHLEGWTAAGKMVAVPVGVASRTTPFVLPAAPCPCCSTATALRVTACDVDVQPAPSGRVDDWSECSFAIETKCKSCGAEVEVCVKMLMTLGRVVARSVLHVELNKNKIRSFVHAMRGPARPLPASAEDFVEAVNAARPPKPRKPRPPAAPVDVERELGRIGGALDVLSEFDP